MKSKTGDEKHNTQLVQKIRFVGILYLGLHPDVAEKHRRRGLFGKLDLPTTFHDPECTVFLRNPPGRGHHHHGGDQRPRGFERMGKASFPLAGWLEVGAHFPGDISASFAGCLYDFIIGKRRPVDSSDDLECRI